MAKQQRAAAAPLGQQITDTVSDMALAWQPLEPSKSLPFACLALELEGVTAEIDALDDYATTEGKADPWADNHLDMLRDRQDALFTLAMSQPADSLDDALLQVVLLEDVALRWASHANSPDSEPHAQHAAKEAEALFRMAWSSIVRALRKHLGVADSVSHVGMFFAPEKYLHMRQLRPVERNRPSLAQFKQDESRRPKRT